MHEKSPGVVSSTALGLYLSDQTDRKIWLNIIEPDILMMR